MDNALTYARDHYDRFIADLEALLRIPSISTDPAYAGEVRRCAEWLVEHLRQIGMAQATLFETDGHPIVYAEHHVGDDRPTVLVYGHYDVQPPDPLELWTSPPFEPVIRDGVLYARGACDDKGQFWMHVKAAEAYLHGEGALPLNLKILLEGEEESGSVHLAPFIRAHRDLLAADVVLISDTAMFARDVPSITYGLRGLAYVEVTLTGPNRDLHSGSYGGAIENPINTLARLIAGLHDAEHRITIPGFYDDVRPLTEEERATYRALPFDEAAWLADVGVRQARTEAGYSVLEAKSARPTLDVNGIWGGYTGQGAKTVLPSQAHAKISMRLVPDQQPDDIVARLRQYFEAHTPPTMTLRFTDLHGGKPVIVDVDNPAMQAAAEAMAGVYGKKPYFTREGGSIPVVADFKEILGIDTVLMGFGLNSDALHSPNEHFGLDRFREGVETIIRFHATYPTYV
ncbi:MAG: dipeptidase [Bacteroidetes bacterium]|nr:MAG: dipeptidase [Bacteroidota bacterium]